MSEVAKHAPGPWRGEFSGGRGSWIAGHDGSWVALSCGEIDEIANANARLIVAAPELLELAKLVHGSFGGGRVVTFSDDDIAAFEAVIAKAEGRS